MSRTVDASRVGLELRPAVRASRVTVEPAGIASLIAASRQGDPAGDRDLLLQALLHLPRIAGLDGTIGTVAAQHELDRLRAIRMAELAPFRLHGVAPKVPPGLRGLEVRVVEPTDAAPILGHFHYLRSFREDGFNIGAIHHGRIVALCSVSPLDLPPITESLPIAGASEAAVVSRVFAFDWAPRNVVSYLLARAEGLVAARGDVRMLLTYLNPNMGFSGASYRASNWLPLGQEIGTRYAYSLGRYVTDRHVSSLPAHERVDVEYSKMPLRPLVLLCRLLDRQLRRKHPQGFEFVFERNESRSPALPGGTRARYADPREGARPPR